MSRHPASSCLRPALVALLAPALLAAQTKPTLQPRDYGRWESLAPAKLSPDGRWLAYGVTRVSEDNELRLRPVARDTTIVVPRATGPVFTPDSKWLAYAIELPPAERERLEREKKPIRTAMGLRSLVSGDTMSLADVSSFRFSADGRFLAIRRYPAEGKRTADLIVQRLATGARLVLGNVSEFSWSDTPTRALLALTVETESGVGNAVELLDAGTGTLRALDSSPSRYRALAWRKRSDDLAVLRTVADSQFRDTAHVALAFRRVGSASPARHVLDPASARGFPRDLRIAEHRRPEWAADGTTIYVGLRPRDPAPARDAAPVAQVAQAGRPGARRGGDSARAAPAEPVSDVQVWHAKDVRIMPMQKAQEQRDLQRTLLTAWHLGDGRVVRLARDLFEDAHVLPGDAFATETDHSRFAFGQMFGRPFEDVYVVDVRTGERKRALTQVRHFFGASPSGKRLLWYDSKDYWAYDVATGASTNLSARAGPKADFANHDWDYPHDFLPPHGVAGWTKDERLVLVYDEYDVWSLAADGSGGRPLTNGAADHVVHRVLRLDRADPSANDEGIDESRPIHLSLYGKRSKRTGFARLAPLYRSVVVGSAEPLVLEDARLARLARADSADVFAFTRERFDVSPDWFVGGPALKDAARVSTTNPFQRDYAWGRAEVVDFRSDGAAPRDLQAALFYPANFDSTRKYPMIVYTYELLSQNVHNYAAPSERSYYDPTVFTQQGYFVLMPDIVFRDREPGISVLEAVVPAVRAVVQRGLVAANRVGHVGHSWGGYEATFLPTRTNIFAASVAGAPITNFLSFAGMVHWTPGIAEWDHWETGQARMGVPFWEDLDAYLRNSPAAKVNELKTPMLMEVGDADGTVDWHEGLQFYNYARRAGRDDFVLLMYPGEDHGLRKKENQVDYERRILQWFGHYLKGEPAPAWITRGVSWEERKRAVEERQ